MNIQYIEYKDQYVDHSKHEHNNQYGQQNNEKEYFDYIKHDDEHNDEFQNNIPKEKLGSQFGYQYYSDVNFDDDKLMITTPNTASAITYEDNATLTSASSILLPTSISTTTSHSALTSELALFSSPSDDFSSPTLLLDDQLFFALKQDSTCQIIHVINHVNGHENVMSPGDYLFILATNDIYTSIFNAIDWLILEESSQSTCITAINPYSVETSFLNDDDDIINVPNIITAAILETLYSTYPAYIDFISYDAGINAEIYNISNSIFEELKTDTYSTKESSKRELTKEEEKVNFVDKSENIQDVEDIEDIEDIFGYNIFNFNYNDEFYGDNVDLLVGNTDNAALSISTTNAQTTLSSTPPIAKTTDIPINTIATTATTTATTSTSAFFQNENSNVAEHVFFDSSDEQFWSRYVDEAGDLSQIENILLDCDIRHDPRVTNDETKSTAKSQEQLRKQLMKKLRQQAINNYHKKQRFQKQQRKQQHKKILYKKKESPIQPNAQICPLIPTVDSNVTVDAEDCDIIEDLPADSELVSLESVAITSQSLDFDKFLIPDSIIEALCAKSVYLHSKNIQKSIIPSHITDLLSIPSDIRKICQHDSSIQKLFQQQRSSRQKPQYLLHLLTKLDCENKKAAIPLFQVLSNQYKDIRHAKNIITLSNKFLHNKIQHQYTPMDWTGCLDLHGYSKYEAERMILFTVRRYCFGIGAFHPTLESYMSHLDHTEHTVIQQRKEHVLKENCGQDTQLSYNQLNIYPVKTGKQIHFPFKNIRIITGRGTHTTTHTKFILTLTVPLFLQKLDIQYTVNPKNPDIFVYLVGDKRQVNLGSLIIVVSLYTSV